MKSTIISDRLTIMAVLFVLPVACFFLAHFLQGPVMHEAAPGVNGLPVTPVAFTSDPPFMEAGCIRIL